MLYPTQSSEKKTLMIMIVIMIMMMIRIIIIIIIMIIIMIIMIIMIMMLIMILIMFSIIFMTRNVISGKLQTIEQSHLAQDLQLLRKLLQCPTTT